MVVDAFTYNGEREILRIHLSVLNPYVDKFIICEAKTTFSGKPKPLYFSEHEKYFKSFWKKIDYHIIDEDYTEQEIMLAESSPNTRGAAHWKTEFLQKESILKALTRLDDEDIVYIGDVDEIWRPFNPVFPTKLKLKVYAYYLNNRSSEVFWGTLVSRYEDIKDECLNHMRSTQAMKTTDDHGWHFTSMGGYDEVKRKLDDSYTSESYNTNMVQELLQDRVKAGVDYLGRPFTFKKEEKEWPEYLKSNRALYKNMLV